MNSRRTYSTAQPGQAMPTPTGRAPNIPVGIQRGTQEPPERTMFGGMQEAHFSGNFTMQNFTVVQDRNQPISKTFKEMSVSVQPGNSPTARDTETPQMADHEIYHEHLLLKKRGIPLWVPGPSKNLPPEYRRNGIAFGDVGILHHSGEFDFLFNVFLPADHPINRAGVPELFRPLDPTKVEHDIEHNPVYGSYDYLACSTLRKISNYSEPMAFQSSRGSTNGAVLVMQDGATSWNLRNTRILDKYAEDNLTRWYKYAIEDRGRSTIVNGDIRVVCGFDKVSSWAIATFASSNRAEEPVRLTLCVDRGTGAHYWDCHGAAGGRSGPFQDEMEGLGIEPSAPPPQNQSVFVRMINPILPIRAWKDIATLLIPSGNGGMPDSPPTGSASRQPLSKSGQSSSNPTPAGRPRLPPRRPFRRTEFESSIIHPSTLINERLLKEFPDARMVITHDSDWISVLKEEDVTFPDEEELATRILAAHRIRYENGIVTIGAKDDVNDGSSSLVAPASIPIRCYPARALPPRHLGLVSARGLGPPDDDESDSEESDDED